MKEVQTELAKETEMLAEEQRAVISTTKMLEEVARERTQLTAKHYDELEQAKMALDRVQTTYQTKLLDYDVQAQATTTLIKKMKDEKQATEDSIKLGVEQIQMIVTAWKNRMKTNIDDCAGKCGINGRSKRQNYKFSESMRKIGRRMATISTRWMMKVLSPSRRICKTISFPWPKLTLKPFGG